MIPRTLIRSRLKKAINGQRGAGGTIHYWRIRHLTLYPDSPTPGKGLRPARPRMTGLVIPTPRQMKYATATAMRNSVTMMQPQLLLSDILSVPSRARLRARIANRA